MKDLINYRNGLPLSSIQKTKKPFTYIYVLLNSAGSIKIGHSDNPAKRIKSLSGSNGAGECIVKAYVTEPTCVTKLESMMQNYYSKYNIKGTEWFKGITFDEVCFKLNEEMQTESYKRYNEFLMKN